MTLSRRARELIALPLFIAGVPGLLLWGAGHVLTLVGRSFWMFAHRVCRDPNCACEECRDFDPEFVRSHQRTSDESQHVVDPIDASEPPTAA